MKVLIDYSNWNNAESKLLFKPPKGMNYSTDMWAPEIHNIDNKWYVIFTADPAGIVHLQRRTCSANSAVRLSITGCLSSSDGSDPWASNYTLKSQLNTYDHLAIDGTYFRHSSGLYHIYSCWYRQYDGWPANLCITKSK
jgi:GH43 family beta-xylosidase